MPEGFSSEPGPSSPDGLSKAERAERIEKASGDEVDAALELQIAKLHDEFKMGRLDTDSLNSRVAALDSVRGIIEEWKAENAEWPISFKEFVEQKYTVATNGVVKLSDEAAAQARNAQAWVEDTYPDDVSNAIGLEGLPYGAPPVPPPARRQGQVSNPIRHPIPGGRYPERATNPPPG